MKTLLLSIKILRKNKILSILLCIEMIAALILLSTTINSWDRTYKEFNIIHRAGLEDSLFFMGRMSTPVEVQENGNTVMHQKTDESYKQDMLQYLSGIDGYLGRSSHTGISLNNGTNTTFVSSFDPLTSEKLRQPTAKGDWYTDVTLDNGRIPCVIMDTHAIPSSYRIGDVIKGTPTVYYNDEYDDVEKNYSFELEFQVVGIVDRMNAFMLNNGDTAIYGEDAAALRDIFYRVRPNTTTVLCGEVPGVEPEDQMYGLLYFDNQKIDETQLEQIHDKISQYGYCYKISDMAKTTQRVIKQDNRIQIPQALVLSMIVITGLICITLLNAKKQIRTFGIYGLCGASWPRCLFIYFCYFFILLLASFLVFIVFMACNYMADSRGLFYLYYLSAKTVGLSLLVCVVISLLSTLIPYADVKKKSLISRYHTN